MRRFVYDLNMAVTALLLYGVVGQMFVEKSVFFPSTVINNELFEDFIGVPIQLFRAVTAIVLAFSMIRVLRALEVENQQRLEAIENAKIEEERRSREELARLNAELQTANEESVRLLSEVQQRDAFRGELLQRITTAQESERKRIARELHDGTGQALTGLALGLRGIVNLLRNESIDCGPLPVPQLAELEAMATNSLGELRHLINDLRPPQLDDMGLVAALRWQVDRFSKRGDIQAALDVIGKPYALPSDVETMLFRIVQEGLTNIAKHAHAEHARVTVNFQNGLEITVRDDGIGFDPSAIAQTNQPRMAWGLLGMQERASLIGATLTFDSAPNQGTTLTVRLDKSVKEIDHGDTSGDH
jgi:signal transduction histidine kinase